MQIEELQQEIPRIFAPWIAQMGLQVLSAEPGRVRLRLPIKAEFVHVGGVMCGQATTTYALL